MQILWQILDFMEETQNKLLLSAGGHLEVDDRGSSGSMTESAQTADLTTQLTWKSVEEIGKNARGRGGGTTQQSVESLRSEVPCIPILLP